jgi:hypothetical protein
MDIEKYIGYYQHVWPYDLDCDGIRETNFDYQPSTYSDHHGKVVETDRVKMDEVWVKFGDKGYDEIKQTVEKVCSLYSQDHPLFSVQRMTDFRINRYSEGGFMSKHCDNIHHSHGQQYGFPQATVLLYLNDDYEGGEFYVANKKFEPSQASALIFPSNFMFPHEAKVVTKGTRWSIVAWLM